MFLLSYNEVLAKYYCHYLRLNIPEKDQNVQAEKIEDNFSAVREVEEEEISVKVLPFIHSFVHGGRINILTTKGLFSWSPVLDAKAENKF